MQLQYDTKKSQMTSFNPPNNFRRYNSFNNTDPRPDQRNLNYNNNQRFQSNINNQTHRQNAYGQVNNNGSNSGEFSDQT